MPHRALAALLVVLGAAVASATEIAPPPPLGASPEAAVSALELLHAWTSESTLDRLGGGERRYPTLDARTSDAPPAALVAVEAARGGPVLHLPGPLAAGLPAYPLPTSASGGRGGAFDLVLATSVDGADGGAATLTVPTDASLAGGTRFDVRTSAWNAVEIGGDVVDDLVAHVVATPEPGTLALFALGAAGLLLLTRARARRAPRCGRVTASRGEAGV